MPNASPLSIQQLNKSFDSHHVLQDISFDLKEGEIFGLIGLNGAGKTTMIKIILDLLKADSGDVSIFDENARTVNARKNICYLPEKFQPSRYLKGMEFLDMALSYYSKKLDREQARELSAAFDLRPEMLEERVGAYSKGMGQKLGLMSAFMVAPPFLILDEPMSGLDPSARIKLKRMLRKAREEGATIFFSSHILSDIDEICDRIGIIHDGKLLYVGTPKQFRKEYGGTLEEAFLGAIGEGEAGKAA